MADHDFIQVTPDGQIPSSVKVPYLSLPENCRGTFGLNITRPFSYSQITTDITSFGSSSTVPSYSSQRFFSFNSSARFRYGGVPTTWSSYGDNTFGFNQITGAATGFNFAPWTVDMVVNGADVSFGIATPANGEYLITVDDLLVHPNWQVTGASPATAYWKLVFPTARARRVRLYLGAGFAFKGAYTPGTGDVQAPAHRPRVALIGDGVALSLTNELALHTGWDIYSLTQIGTGYQANAGVANGRDIYGATSRMNALAALPAMDLVVVASSVSDAGLTQGTTVGNAQALWQAIRTARPTTPLVVIGPPTKLVAAQAANLDSLNTALKAVAIPAVGVDGYIDQRTSTWITASVLTGTLEDEPEQFWLTPDGLLFTRDGNTYVAKRIVQEFARIRMSS